MHVEIALDVFRAASLAPLEGFDIVFDPVQTLAGGAVRAVARHLQRKHAHAYQGGTGHIAVFLIGKLAVRHDVLAHVA